MSQPMLGIQLGEPSAAKVTPNLLPCKIDHDGSIGPVQSYWRPSQSEEGARRTAYFRGRKLQGQALKVPEGYRGIVVERRAPPEAAADNQGSRAEPEVIDLEQDDQEEEQVVLGNLEAQAEFDEMVVWGHEELPDAASDPYVRSVEEWLSVADQIHSFDTPKKAE